jgi:hypothetical protein
VRHCQQKIGQATQRNDRDQAHGTGAPAHMGDPADRSTARKQRSSSSQS